MNDHDRFTKLMDETLSALIATINKSNATLPQKDGMIGLARELRQAAYQAGGTERED